MAASTAVRTRVADATEQAPTDPAYRLFDVAVRRVERVGASFVRLTFGGEQLAAFGAGGHDQRIKVLLPRGAFDAALAPATDWYLWWRALPDADRPVMRTYTVRAVRPHLRELDVDFVLHGVADGHAGPASAWAAAVAVGDRVVLAGPGAAGTGRMWGVEWAPPPEARTLLLAADETAVPAVCAVLESLPAGVRATALLEVPEVGDVLEVRSDADLTVEWLPRARPQGAHPHGERLVARVQEVAGRLVDEQTRAPQPGDDDDTEAEADDTALLWEVPEHAVASGPECLYAWLAGEAGVVKQLRRHLVREVGVPRQSVAFMGYWREGRREGE
ncbi:SIP domain-containing protein [Kineococcus sp. R8]|uniref:siderophore-interacting protein n=1 Tax=Kineococcus siccus TaxID=2696567 RepID=UPI00141285BE|nr:siderophore-interacting protein [Kineococcus siccus]NAZ81643.1 SIP domain-containing protein [Kineococcus siccus]